jgi:hypothetical protein
MDVGLTKMIEPEMRPYFIHVIGFPPIESGCVFRRAWTAKCEQPNVWQYPVVSGVQRILFRFALALHPEGRCCELDWVFADD